MLITYLNLLTPRIGKGEAPIGQTETPRTERSGFILILHMVTISSSRAETLRPLKLTASQRGGEGPKQAWPYLADEEVDTEGPPSLSEQSLSPPTVLSTAASSPDRTVLSNNPAFTNQPAPATVSWAPD